MAFCSFAEGAGIYDATPIENMFLLEYLPTAPDGFLRVYLYARMLSLHPELGEDLEDMARALNMDTEAVLNAMSYWERQGLARRLSDRPPAYAMLPVRFAAETADPMEGDYYEYRDFNANLQSLFGPDCLLHPKQYEMANDWLNLLGFTQEAVLKMVEAQLKKSRARKPDPDRVFTQLDKLAQQWSERGVRTAEDVERALSADEGVRRAASAVAKQLGLRRAATPEELKLVEKWLGEWAFTQEEILAACAETTKSRTPTMAYLDRVLEGRRRGDGERFDGLKAALREMDIREAPTPDQLAWYAERLQEGFEPETVRLAAVQCARKRKLRFDDLRWMVGKWAELGLFRFDAADAYIREQGRLAAGVRALLERCGSDRRPQMGDLEQYARWLAESSAELIDYAAECARGMQMPMRYIDKLLASWRKSGVETVEAARAERANRAAAPGTRPSAAPNPALNYEQRTHAESDYDGLFIDLDAWDAEGADGSKNRGAAK